MSNYYNRHYHQTNGIGGCANRFSFFLKSGFGLVVAFNQILLPFMSGLTFSCEHYLYMLMDVDYVWLA